MEKLVIDTTPLYDQYSNRGIGVYTKNLIAQFITEKNFEIHLIGFKDKSTILKILNLRELPAGIYFHSLGKTKLSGLGNITFYKQNYLPLLKKIKPVIHISTNFERSIFNNYGWKNIVVIHDIIPLINNSFSKKSPVHNFIKKRFYIHQLKNALKAELIVTISKYSKSNIINLFKLPKNKIVVNYLALDVDFDKGKLPDQRRMNVILKSHKINSEYMLYYGGLEENKNVANLVYAFKQISNLHPEIKLVIVSNEIKGGLNTPYIVKAENGKKLLQLVKKLQLQDKIIFTGELDRADLKIVTLNAKLFVHLSKAEGFGLSVLEALSNGTPAVISDIPVYRELFFNNAVLADPNNIDEIVASIHKLIENTDLQAEFKIKNEELKNKYSWRSHISKFEELINGITTKYTPTSTLTKQRTRLAYIIPHFHPFVGGAENYALEIASIAAKNDFDVSVYTAKTNNFENDFDIYKRIKIYRSSVLFKGYYLKFYPGLLWKILKSDANVFHVQGFGFVWQDFCLISKKFFSRKHPKFINTPHGPFMARKNYPAVYKIIKKVYTTIQKTYLNWLYDTVIEVNPEQHKWLVNDYKIKRTKIKFLPIGLNFETLQKPDSVYLDRKIQKLLKDKLVISYLGRFHKYKGIHDLFKAFSKLVSDADYRQVILVMMGKDAGEFKQLQKYVIENRLEENVVLLESPSNKLRNYILNLSEIFVFPSEWEAYGIAMLEAMFFGNAVISTRTEGGCYLIENNQNGILYTSGDIEGLFKSLIKLVGNSELRAKMITNNIQKAKQLSWEKIWQEYRILYGKS